MNTEFKAGDYIVLLKGPSDTVNGCIKPGYVYKQKRDCFSIMMEKDLLQSTTNGWVRYRFDKTPLPNNNLCNNDVTDWRYAVTDWRYAYPHEITRYDTHGGPVEASPEAVKWEDKPIPIIKPVPIIFKMPRLI